MKLKNVPMDFKKVFSLFFLVTLLHLSSFAKSNFPCLEGTTISTTTGETSIILNCDGTGADGFIKVRANYQSMPTAYIVVDQNDVILSIGYQQNIDLNQFPGNIKIYAFTFLGTISAQVGDNLSGTELSDYCYNLSSNFIAVTSANLDGGTVQLDNGETTTTVCVNDGTDDILHFNSTDAAGGTNFTYVITDASNNILSIPSGDTQNFEAAPQGICHIWGLVYEGDLLAEVGNNIITTELSNDCFGLSSNFITVNRQDVAAGQISFSDNGESFYELCSNTQSEVNMTASGNTGDNFAYIITSSNGGIETIIDGSANYLPQTGFSNIRYIYGIAYAGDAYTATEIQDLITQNINDVVLRENCFDLSSPIELQVSVVDGGSVELEDGSTSVFICSNDVANGTIVLQNTSNPNTSQSYVLTDIDNNIITFLAGNTLNLTIAASGDYRIWSISYTGNLTGEINDPLMGTALSDGCYDISSSSVYISKTDVDSGTLTLGDGSISRILCPDGNTPLVINFNTEGAVGQNYTYILTDTDGTIVENFDNNSFDFESNLASGVVHFWGVSYTGTFDLPFGENINEAVFSDDCFDLTSNYVEVIYEVAFAGTLSTDEGITEFSVCAGEGAADLIHFVVTDANSLNYAYLITTPEGILIEIVTDDSYDFDNTAAGDSRVYGLSYSGLLTIVPGNDIFSSILSSDCADISANFLSVSKTIVDGGIVSSNFTENTIYVCAGDGLEDSIEFSNTSIATEANYTYVLTTEDGIVLSVLDNDSYDFEADATRTYQLWGLSYTGNFLGGFGSNIYESDLSDDCFVLSENYLTIVQDRPDVSQVSTLDGETDISLCIGAESNSIVFDNTSTSTSGYAYLLLNSDGEIMAIYTDNTIDFSILNVGLYHIQGLSYTGTLSAEVGEVPSAITLASSCYELSENLINITREPEVDGGIISLLDNPETTVYTCPGDGIADLFIFQSNSTDEDFLYVVTDTSNNIVVPQIISPAIDFEAASPGIYRVYGISFNGNSNIAYGINVLEDELSDKCYTPSDNFITVVILTPVGGSVTSDQGTTVDITVGDGITDSLTFSNIDVFPTLYTYIITDENNEILGFVDGDIHDFEDAPAGICRVWGVAHTGVILAEIGDILTDGMVSDDCYELSENFVTINRTLGGLRSENNDETTSFIQVSTYPNPANERFTANIEIDNSTILLSEVSIINTSGQILNHRTVATDNGFNSIEINIENLQPGVYVLMVRNGKTQEMIRFIKQ